MVPWNLKEILPLCINDEMLETLVQNLQERQVAGRLLNIDTNANLLSEVSY